MDKLHNPHPNTREYLARLDTEKSAPISAEAAENQYILSLGEILPGLWKRMWFIMVVTLTVASATLGYSLMQTPLYEASVKILVGQAPESSNPGSLGSDIQGLQQLTKTMAYGVGTRPVAESVIQQLDLQMTEPFTDSSDPTEDFLEDYLRVKPIADTQFIEVSYRDPSPEKAAQIANAVGDAFSRQVSEVSPSANAIRATMWQRAVTPDSPASPNIARNVLLALVLGLMLGIGSAFLLEYLDDRWRSPEEVERISGVPTVAVIPKYNMLPQERTHHKQKVP